MTDLMRISNMEQVTENQFPPLISIVERFLSSLDCSKGSIDTYTRQLKSFIEWIYYSGKTLDLTTWVRQDILEYKQYLKVSECNGRHLTGNTIAGYITVVRKFWAWLEIEGICKNIIRT